jgi:type II restriction/modification system DNA methylase subunit YeeA
LRGGAGVGVAGPERDGAMPAAARMHGAPGVETSQMEPPPPPAPSPQGGGEGAPYVEASWPEAEFIVGNPPFLGGKLMRRGLGDDYVDTLFAVYEGRVPPEADLVTYWFEKARAQIAAGKTKRAGLVATNSIRGGANRRVLARAAEDAPIFEAWSDEEWTIDGAAVRVSLLCFANDISAEPIALDGRAVPAINADLTGGGVDLTKAVRLKENEGVAFMGDTKGGAFDVPGELARSWLQAPLNPNGRPNADVLKPWVNGLDVTRRPRDMWIVDFGWTMSEAEAALYEEPFSYAVEQVKPERSKNRRESYARHWWRHVEPRPKLRSAVSGMRRYLTTPRVAKHRIFVWVPCPTVPDSRVFAFAREGDFFFGLLQSRFHEAWSLRTCSWHGVGNDPTYNSETCFETFPFPEGLTPNIPAADYAGDPRAVRIAAAAKELDERRRAWLNPPDLVRAEPEVVPGYPDRILPKDERAAAILKGRTLTNLYNERPAWLDNLHRDLDRAVAAAYGWPEDIATEDALARLLDLNLARAAAGR